MTTPTERDVNRVKIAIDHLKIARELLKHAGATKATAKVRLALTSAGGALRHAEGKRNRLDRANAEGRRFLVTVDYQDTNGVAQSERVRVTARDEDDACDKANAIVKSWPNCMKIVGGSVEMVEG